MIISMKYTILIFLSSLTAHGISDADKSDITHGGLADFIYLGAKHMVTGYDHILFLIGVIFFLTKFSDIVRFVTAFTIGHSITLVFATLYQVSANYYLIDAVIAFSVIYKGFENLGGFKKIFCKSAPNLIAMVFVFGLIHGFGLSTRLQQLHLPDHNLLYSILSFNVGVELGQIAALAIVYPCLLIIRGELLNKLSTTINWALVISGIVLMVYQMNGYFTNHNHNDNDNVEEVEIHKHNGHTHSHDDDEKKHEH